MTHRRRSAIALYIGLSYGITWWVWLPYLRAAVSSRSAPPGPFLFYLGALGPLVAALAAEGYERGASGVRDLLVRLVDWRRAGWWMGVGLLSPLLLVPAAVLGLSWVGEGIPDLTRFGVTARAPGQAPLTTWLLMFVSYGIGEEVGWRGFLLPRLQTGRHALKATLWLTLIWAGWHVPAFWFREGYVELGWGGTVGFMIGLAAGAIVLTFLYNASGGSILVVALWHGSWNWVATSDALQGPWVAAMTAIIMLTAPVLVWCCGAKNLASGSRPVMNED